MNNLKKFFPFVDTYYSDKGISMSQAQREAEELRNETQRLLSLLPERLYKKVKTLYSASGVTNSEDPFNSGVDPKKYESILLCIADNNAKAARLRFAVKQLDDIRKGISTIDKADIMKELGLSLPVKPEDPYQRKATGMGIDTYCEQDQVEKLLLNAKPELYNKLADTFAKALEAEARAAVFGKHVANEDSFLRRLLKSPEVGQTSTTQNESIIIQTQDVLAYDKHDWVESEQEMMKLYTDLQSKRNQYVKIIKDTAREMQRQYDAEFSLAINQWRRDLQEYNARLQEIELQIEEYKSQLHQELNSLKIKM